MGLILDSSDDELKSKFYSLKDIKDVAGLLEIKTSHLVYLLYRLPLRLRYSTFTIKKKSGEPRYIQAPVTTLKIIQRKLNYILRLIYKNKACVHGFCNQRSIVTNAQIHYGKEYVFNVDLKDFFPSINFGRVRGMFIGVPYKIHKGPATILAQICCYDGRLPEGSPTSPTISNMVCGKLDSQLQKLAYRYNLDYSRYCDDISFSSKSTRWPVDALVKIDKLDTDNWDVKAGDALQKIIRENGFEINKEKVRISFRGRRQEITGLVVNKFPNVRRKFIRQVRTMLNLWFKRGEPAADTIFFANFDKKLRNWHYRPSFRQVLQGKINFIKMVKGEKNAVFAKLINKFNTLTSNPKRYLTTFNEIVNAAIWIIEADVRTGAEENLRQGTAFRVQSGRLITCYHVVANATKIEVYKPEDESIKHKCEVVCRDDVCDIAILRFVADTQPIYSLELSQDVVRQGDKITIAGFPQYTPGASVHIFDAKMASSRNYQGQRLITIDKPLVIGNSGGPALNQENKVIGICRTGNDSVELKYDFVDFCIQPVGVLFEDGYLKDALK